MSFSATTGNRPAMAGTVGSTNTSFDRIPSFVLQTCSCAYAMETMHDWDGQILKPGVKRKRNGDVPENKFIKLRVPNSKHIVSFDVSATERLEALFESSGAMHSEKCQCLPPKISPDATKARLATSQWYLQVQMALDLSPQTIGAAIALYSRFLASSRPEDTKGNARLVSVVALWMSSKLHEIQQISKESLCSCLEDSGSYHDLIDLEWCFLQKLGGSLLRPTPTEVAFQAYEVFSTLAWSGNGKGNSKFICKAVKKKIAACLDLYYFVPALWAYQIRDIGMACLLTSLRIVGACKQIIGCILKRFSMPGHYGLRDAALDLMIEYKKVFHKPINFVMDESVLHKGRKPQEATRPASPASVFSSGSSLHA